MSAAYRQLHINTSRERMEYSDFPMPKSYPDFPHHAQIAAYFDAYVEHFGLRDRIRFETRVQRAARLQDGGWELTLDDGSVERFDALLVANGHHWDPRWPEPMFPGPTASPACRSTPTPTSTTTSSPTRTWSSSAWATRRWTSRWSPPTWRATRTSPPAAARGSSPSTCSAGPLDQLPQDPRVPFKVRQRMIHALIKLHVGNPARYGLPAPDHKFGEAHPTVSGRILDRIAHGDDRAEAQHRAASTATTCEFDDGSRAHVDVVVYCTGYKISFPFFDADLISAPDNHIELFRRVFHPEVADVFFVALLQPLGATMPLAEAQGQWIADYLKGEYALPPRRRPAADIEDDAAAMRRRYVASKRHTIQVDFDDYLHDAGARSAGPAPSARARRASALPVAARAAPAQMPAQMPAQVPA